MSDSTAPRRAKRRFSTPVIVAGGLSSLLLSFSFTPTFSALTAAITNSDNTAGTGTLVMQETSGAANCTTDASGTATCSTINKYGGTGTLLAPGGAHQTVNVTIANVGSIDAATFTLDGLACSTADGTGSYHGTGNLCDKLNIKITSGGATVFDGTGNQLDAHAAFPLSAVAAGGSAAFTFDVSFPAGTGDNAYQGRVMSQQLVWTFQS